MADNPQRGGLGFEKFFRRKSSSVERAKDPEKSVKTAEENVEISRKTETESSSSKIGKSFNQKSLEDKNDPTEDRKNVGKQTDDISSEKTNESKKSTKKGKTSSGPESNFGKADEKIDASEARNEYIIKDGQVGQVKLTEIINNSIKEAVLNIVKEGVCPLAESLDFRGREKPVKKLGNSLEQENHDKENKPGSPDQLSSLVSAANKTFDSHFCQSQCQRSLQILPPNLGKICEISEKCNQPNRELRSPVNATKKLIKCPKQKAKRSKDKEPREGSPKISRNEVKGRSSHFRTDNRRMTGNVNIYICSEANENTKNGKTKSKNTKDCNDYTESTSGTAASSTLSLSTSKLVAALRKKQEKNLDNQSFKCGPSVPSKNSVETYKSYSKIGDGVDGLDGVDDGVDGSCLCDDDSNQVELPDSRSTSSKDFCLCEDTKFGVADFSRSDQESFNEKMSSGTSCEFVEHDRDDNWSCDSDRCPSHENSWGPRRFCPFSQGDNGKIDLEEGHSCWNLNRCNNDRPIVVACPSNWKNKSENRVPRDKYWRTNRDGEKFDKCLCVVEEEEENCCNERKKSEVKFTVCGKGVDDDDDEERCDAGKIDDFTACCSSSGSRFDSSKREKENFGSPRLEKKSTVCVSRIGSSSSDKIEKKKDVDVEAEEKTQQQSQKSNLLSTLTKNFKRSSGKKDEKPKNPTDLKKEEVRVKSNEAEENQPKVAATTNFDEKSSSGPNEKPKNSLFYRSIKKAMDIVKIRKNDEGDAEEEGKKNWGSTSESQTRRKNEEDQLIIDKAKKNDNFGEFSSGIDREKFVLDSKKKSKEEKRSKSRISSAISSRRNSATTSHDSSNLSISKSDNKQINNCPNSAKIEDVKKSQNSGQKSSNCNCEKFTERSECRCKKPESPKNQSCNCHVTCKKKTSETKICCKPIAPRREIYALSSRSENPAENCNCCNEKSQLIESESCKFCLKCNGPITECKCCCNNKKKLDPDFCNCCLRQKNLCCCNLAENSSVNKWQVKNSSQSRDFSENLRRCDDCCRPKIECNCRCDFGNWKCPKSMICIYCDEPLENCICKAPVRKCSQCGFLLDVCNCKILTCDDFDGRKIVPIEENNPQTICVTAWKPRRNVRRYFARETDDDPVDNYEEDFPCYEKNKPYGSDKLAYQKGSVFSNVMNELQQKISGSMCCNICRNVPCNCCMKNNEDDRRRKGTLSNIQKKRNVCRSRNRSRSKSPVGSCKCSTPRKKSGRKMTVFKVCDRCRTSPCRCRRSSGSPQKKPPAKCYYCKSSPCICPAARETTNVCPFRKSDSSHRRKKDYSFTEENFNGDLRNDNNGHRSRGKNRVIPYSENQQMRKYCYRENPTGEQTLSTEERCR